MKTIAFIGAGNMGGALARAACRAIDPKEVVIYEPNAAAAAALAEETGCIAAASGAEAVRAAKYVMLCVKPQVLPGVLGGLVPALKDGIAAGEHRVLVSIAAGVQLATLAGILAAGGVELPTVRIMPNTPASIGEGVLLMAPDAAVTDEDYSGLTDALRCSGLLERVTEAQLDMGSAISGCGPAFVYLFIEALADGGVQIGLPRDKAQAWAAKMVAGSAEMVLRSGKHPGQIKDAVCSPGGTTIAGVAELENRAFRAAAAQAVVAAYEKNSKLAKQ